MSVRCTVCKGTNIRVVTWANPNTGETFDVGNTSYKEDAATGASFCEDCDDNTELMED